MLSCNECHILPSVVLIPSVVLPIIFGATLLCLFPRIACGICGTSWFLSDSDSSSNRCQLAFALYIVYFIHAMGEKASTFSQIFLMKCFYIFFGGCRYWCLEIGS